MGWRKLGETVVRRIVGFALISMAILVMLDSMAKIVCAQAVSVSSRTECHLRVHAVLTGFPDGSMYWDQTLTRAQASKILTVALGKQHEAPGLSPLPSQTFFDVPRNHWASGHIEIGLEMGLYRGYPDGTFRPESPVTVAEFSVMVARAYAALGHEDVSNPVVATVVPQWAAEEILSCEPLVRYYSVEEGATLSLDMPMPRGAAAHLIYDVMEELGLLYDLKGTLAGYDSSEHTVELRLGPRGSEVTLDLQEGFRAFLDDQEVTPEQLLGREVGVVLDGSNKVVLLVGVSHATER